MTNPTPEYRFYGELAVWWPLISPPEDYQEEAGFLADVLHRAADPVVEVLELGSGGGHVALYLKKTFVLTLVDLSTEMLDVSRQLNPECEHLEGDMRTVTLGREFDAVFVHDAVDYMTTEVDLRRAVATAFLHCRPGGVALFVPDNTVETFEEQADHDGHDAGDGRGVRFLEWSWDPHPDDTWTLTEYVFLLRDADGVMRVVHETHRTGLFKRDLWLQILADIGFEPEAIAEKTTESRTPREMFLGRKPYPKIG